MAKELHIWLDTVGTSAIKEHMPLYTTLVETNSALKYSDVVHTTLPTFLSFRYAERLFVHVDGTIHEITTGQCDGTNREIRESHNLQNLLFAGEFDWFTGISSNKN